LLVQRAEGWRECWRIGGGRVGQGRVVVHGGPSGTWSGSCQMCNHILYKT
jgi:hypothetical protein